MEKPLELVPRPAQRPSTSTAIMDDGTSSASHRQTLPSSGDMATSTIETSPRHFSTFSAFSARQHKTETVSASRSVQCRRSVLGLTTTLVLLISTSPSHFLFLPATPRRSSEGALATLGARHDCHISVHLICSIIVVVSPSLLLFASYTDNHNTT